ncbi:hypothetical protein FM036_16845 [Nostoc sp. HG1]|nr:hypothetical protein [Nostoc sp. HG1]
MNKALTSDRQGFANEKPSILTQTFPNNQESRISELSNHISQTSTKYLKAGCCDVALRPCPDPDELLRSPSLNLEESFYLQRLVKLDWFSGQVAAVLLQIEAKVGGVAV